MSKHILLFLASTSLLCLMLGLFLGQRLSPSKPTLVVPSPAPNTASPTPAWQTYTYTEFSFQFPRYLTPSTENAPSNVLGRLNSPTNSTLSIQKLPKEGIGFECAIQVSSKQFNLDGVTATKTIHISPPKSELCDNDGETTWVTFNNKGILYALTYDYKIANNTQERLLFDQILSTFKFSN